MIFTAYIMIVRYIMTSQYDSIQISVQIIEQLTLVKR
jgi:hypothetical protein